MLVVNKFHFISMVLTPGAKAIICGFFTKIGDLFSYTVKKTEQPKKCSTWYCKNIYKKPMV